MPKISSRVAELEAQLSQVDVELANLFCQKQAENLARYAQDEELSSRQKDVEDIAWTENEDFEAQIAKREHQRFETDSELAEKRAAEDERRRIEDEERLEQRKIEDEEYAKCVEEIKSKISREKIALQDEMEKLQKTRRRNDQADSARRSELMRLLLVRIYLSYVCNILTCCTELRRTNQDIEIEMQPC